jgi:DNA-directed RNA polymerase sigma subunit (sigma70/sigma32)
VDDRKRGVTRPPSKTVTVITEEERKVAARPAERPQPKAKSRKPELTAEEERVLRMRYGIAGAPDMELEFEGQQFEDTRLQLALIERRALEMMSKRGPGGPGGKGRDSETKDKIIRKLRDL